ncbi:iron-containing alcohol dehydrogenase [uncultured Clostridium sp.]|uniref:iron-containing alcohol dehydrogenase n=1 Tax=uncultured Clostridium sp. TaxID=59620 RepID=UPI0025E7F3C4|nr:iron-containing alcohol dehydrogenase [uncultured Clostridium sp.]
MIWNIKKAYYRANQGIFKFGMKFIKFKEQEVISGENSVRKIAFILKEKNINNVLLVSGKTITRLGLLNELIESLKEENIRYYLFNDVMANPTIESVEAGVKKYEEAKAKGIIAFGGGSPMDCAKIIGARVNNKNIQVKDMRGILKIRKNIPLFIAIPTTAGTGSESTVAAVITDSVNHEKYAIVDPKLMPDYAVLDPKLTVALPKQVTSTTGMDALTHAIEAYIGNFGTKETNRNALKSIKIIFDNLEKAYSNGENLEARNSMLIASNYAGLAFTRANVGYVHAIAHALGGIYGVSHGLANAIVLPYVLEYYKESIYKKLSEIAIYTGLGDEKEDNRILYNKVLNKIKDMNSNMNIPNKVNELRENDFEIITKRVMKEGNPGYPVPKIMNEEECIEILKKLYK